MSKDYELRDTVTPLYRKSLLYLIRNALEPRVGEPVLGLEESLRGNPKLVERFGLGGSPSATASVTWSVTAGAAASASTSHGGFDNDVPTMNSVARTILGIADSTQLPASFPPDTEQRNAIQSVTLSAQRPDDGATPPRPPSPTIAMPPRTDGTPMRRALCVGINAYPAPNTLEGCVADSEAWSGALATLGFAVDKLQDAAATHAIVLGRLGAMVDSSQAGDVLVFQYAGHGAEVPDLDGDEPTESGRPGRDQAICPVDFETGNFIIDDDVRAVLDRLPVGVKLTCFLDSCHSGTATRFLVGRQSPQPNARERYVHLSQDTVDKFVAKRKDVNHARALAGGRRSAGTRAEMRWVAFAACRDDESAWESDGHGDFTRFAVPLLRGDAELTNRAFQDVVLKAFGSSRRQTPMLDCNDQDASSPFLVGSGQRSSADAEAAGTGLSGSPETAKSTSTDVAHDPPHRGDRARDVADVLAAIARILR